MFLIRTVKFLKGQMGTRVLSIVEKLSSLGNHDLLCKIFISEIGVNELSEINNERLHYLLVIEYTLENCKSTILSTVVLNSMASFMWPQCYRYEVAFFNTSIGYLKLLNFRGEKKSVFIIFSRPVDSKAGFPSK